MAKNPNKKNKVKEIEERLTYLCEYYPEDPEMYELLKTLARIYIYQNKYTYGYTQVEDICHDVAADTWMRILKKGAKITFWMFYIGKSIKLSYVEKQRKIEHECIDTSDNPELGSAIIDMCAGSSRSLTDQFNSVAQQHFLLNIDNLIRLTLSKTKFKHGSKEWLCLYTCMAMSLNKGTYVYFRMSDDLKPYLRIALNQFRELFRTSSLNEALIEKVDEDLSPMAFLNEGHIKEISSGKDI